MQNEEEEVMACDSCKEVPDNYLSLNCGHCFCLVCMAQNFLKGGRIYKMEGDENINYICQLCEKETQLDEASVGAVETVLKDLILPCLQQLKEGPSQIQQQQEQIQTPKNNAKCEIHTKEEATLFCFTCECKCFCIKCLLKHDNKSHEIQNVSSCLRRLKSKMNDASHTIGASLELMQLQLKRLLDQDQTQQEELEYLMGRVSSQFKGLYEILNSKETEINQQLGNLKEIQQQQSERIQNEIQIKINTFLGLKNDFENISLSEDLIPQVSLLNYYCECKQIMQKVMGQMSFSDIFCQSSSMKYFPDNDQFFKIDDFETKVQLLKTQIDRLQQPQIRSISQHDKFQQRESHLTQRFHTQMDESTDSFKSQSIYSKQHTPMNNQRSLHAKVEEIKNLYSERIKTQQKMESRSAKDLENQIQRSFSELASFKKQTALCALRVQQGLFDSRVTKKQK